MFISSLLKIGLITISSNRYSTPAEDHAIVDVAGLDKKLAKYREESAGISKLSRLKKAAAALPLSYACDGSFLFPRSSRFCSGGSRSRQH